MDRQSSVTVHRCAHPPKLLLKCMYLMYFVLKTCLTNVFIYKDKHPIFCTNDLKMSEGVWGGPRGPNTAENLSGGRNTKFLGGGQNKIVHLLINTLYLY